MRCGAVHALLEESRGPGGLPGWDPICLPTCRGLLLAESPMCCLSRQLPERVRGGTTKLRWVLQQCLYCEGSGLAADCSREKKQGRAGGQADYACGGVTEPRGLSLSAPQ